MSCVLSREEQQSSLHVTYVTNGRHGSRSYQTGYDMPLAHHNAATHNAAMHNASFSQRYPYPFFYSVIAVDALPCFSASPVEIFYIAHIALRPLLPFFLSPQWFTVQNNKKFAKSYNAAMSPLATRDVQRNAQRTTQRCGALRICPCHVRILDPRRKIMVLSRPYLEDYIVLPTRSTVRTDYRNVKHDIRSNTGGRHCVQMVCIYVDQYAS